MILLALFGHIYTPIQNKKSPDWFFYDEPPKRLQQAGALLMYSSTFLFLFDQSGRIKNKYFICGKIKNAFEMIIIDC